MSWLGSALARFGRPAGAVAPAQPRQVAIDWRAQGNAAIADGKLAEAARCYAEGVRQEPGDAALRLNLGYALLEQGQFAAAAERFRQALAMHRPHDGFLHEAHFLLGRAQCAQGEADAALASFKAATRARPDFAEAVEEMVRLLHQGGHHADAAKTAERLLDLRPSAFNRLLLATELSLAGDFGRAEAMLSALCAEDPRNFDAATVRFDNLMKGGRCHEALAHAERVLATGAPAATWHVSIAVALQKLGRLDEALARLDAALILEPNRKDALVDRVSVLIELLRVPEAVTAADAALRSNPDDADLHWNLGIACMLLGDFERGWAESEWRTRSSAFRGHPPALAQPRWRGEDLRARTLYVYGEQGFGDNIQFVRFVPEIARTAGHVLLQVPQALERLLTHLPPNVRLLQQGALLPAVDFHCPLLSLPQVLGTRIDSIPAAVPYVWADAVRVQAWRERLPRDRFNVGIAWSGKSTHVNDHNRSIPLDDFRAITAPACRFVTVQPELRAQDRTILSEWPEAVDFGRELGDFADTAALIEALDLVISVDTSIAHLAGALGKPVWILLPHAPDWRWMLDRADTPWYRTARLYRQHADRSWPPVLARVRADLADLVNRD